MKKHGSLLEAWWLLLITYWYELPKHYFRRRPLLCGLHVFAYLNTERFQFLQQVYLGTVSSDPIVMGMTVNL